MLHSWIGNNNAVGWELLGNSIKSPQKLLYEIIHSHNTYNRREFTKHFFKMQLSVITLSKAMIISSLSEFVKFRSLANLSTFERRYTKLSRKWCKFLSSKLLADHQSPSDTAKRSNNPDVIWRDEETHCVHCMRKVVTLYIWNRKRTTVSMKKNGKITSSVQHVDRFRVNAKRPE